MSRKVNVIGAGIAGSLVARMLRQRGVGATVIDDEDRFSASRASSNLYIASWLKKFSSEKASRGIEILESLFPALYIDQPFESGIADAMKVRHIAQRNLLVPIDLHFTAKSVDSQGVLTTTDNFLPGPTVICTGYRGAELVPDATIDVKVGHCLLIDGVLPKGRSNLSLVSPYTHQKLYQFDADRIYYADSVAVSKPTYERRSCELMRRTMERAAKALGTSLASLEPRVRETRTGFRPFIEGYDFGFADRVMPNVWMLNSGGKNGLVAYACGAEKIVDQLMEEL